MLGCESKSYVAAVLSAPQWPKRAQAMHSEYIEQRNGGFYVEERAVRWTRSCAPSIVATRPNAFWIGIRFSAHPRGSTARSRSSWTIRPK